jgi:4-diphosphocytidyl-2-C-methyl-D-erythritol kinase
VICFPLSKINLGLNIIEKRTDGYHNLNTVFYPISWKDALEVIPGSKNAKRFDLQVLGGDIPGEPEENILYKAWKLLSVDHDLPPLRVILYKNIPRGAGLGGGSSDAASFLKLMNEIIRPRLSDEKLKELASALGSDCPFFLQPQPLYAHGRGDQFSSINVDLSGFYICVVYPGIVSSTSEAYHNVSPKIPKTNLVSIIGSFPVEQWPDLVLNDFEDYLFSKFHELQVMKEYFYRSGALFSGLSGSGSALYAIFREAPKLHFPSSYRVFIQPPAKGFTGH